MKKILGKGGKRYISFNGNTIRYIKWKKAKGNGILSSNISKVVIVKLKLNIYYNQSSRNESESKLIKKNNNKDNLSPKDIFILEKV